MSQRIKTAIHDEGPSYSPYAVMTMADGSTTCEYATGVLTMSTTTYKTKLAYFRINSTGEVFDLDTPHGELCENGHMVFIWRR